MPPTRNASTFRPVLALALCLGFTGGGVAWADPAHPGAPGDPAHPNWVEDPYAPHVTRGNTIRLGTVAGFLYGERIDVYALGLSTAVGHRIGRFAIEAEFDYLNLASRGESNKSVGDGERLGVIARFDLLRLGPHIVGGNSMLAVYVEGGGAVAWNHWYRPGSTIDDPDEAMSIVPDDSKRVEGQVGFGIQLDHRLQEPRGFSRIGWFLGWRLGLAPHDAENAVACRGTACKPAMPTQDARYTDRSMLFQSSISVTW